MSVTSRKGHEGEAGVRDFINLWFPHADQGIGAKIIPSEGQNDRGDIDGVPFTCIEVKNHANPVLGTLMVNAAWKAGNAGRPIWFLAYKRAGFSGARAGNWNAVTTVKGFLDAFKPNVLLAENPFDITHPVEEPGEFFALTPSMIEQLCEEEAAVVAESFAEYPMSPYHGQNRYRWGMLLDFVRTPMKANKYAIGFIHDFDPRVDPLYPHGQAPFVIYPRVNEPVENWYVHTNLHFMCRMLETVGVIPQDITEYEGTPSEEGN